jgi:deoxyribonuclease-4
MIYDTIAFGPSGNSNSFYEAGFKSTMQMPSWLSKRGLKLFEYSFGRGVNISRKTAEEIGAEADKFGIEISVHAPYYINFASLEEDKAQNSVNYLLYSLQELRAFGGKRCVFHVGAQGKQPRNEAFARVRDKLAQALDFYKQNGLDDLLVCPETMGKQAQIGTSDEIIELCKLAENVYPCVDFGHINALTGGTLKTKDDFKKLIDKFFDGLGENKTKNMHVHFSKIQYGDKGEIRHLTFEDEIYGPDFEPYAEVIVEYGLTPHILSESNGTQAEDAKSMFDIYTQLNTGAVFDKQK